MEFWETIIISGLTALLAGVSSYILQERKLKKEIKLINEENKTEFMAEKAARYFLQHAGYTDRSFKVLKKHLGGWDKDEDELRRILVRAGAIRTYREDDTEWWTLLERLPEKYEKLNNGK